MSSLLRLCLVLGFLSPSLAYPAVLDNPSGTSPYSGVGVISGWKCQTSGPLTIRFNGGDSIPLLYGSERSDVLDAGACDSADVGFVAIYNWARLGDGMHTAVAYDNGVEFDRNTFEVVTLGEDFVEGLSGICIAPDFPYPEDVTVLEWNQSTQHFELARGDGGWGFCGYVCYDSADFEPGDDEPTYSCSTEDACTLMHARRLAGGCDEDATHAEIVGWNDVLDSIIEQHHDTTDPEDCWVEDDDT